MEVGERYIHLLLYDQARSQPQSKVTDSRPSRHCNVAGRSLGLCSKLWCLWLSWDPSWSVTSRGLSLLPAPSRPGPQQCGLFHHFSFLDSGFGDLPSLSNDYFSFPLKKLIRDIPAANGGLIGCDNQCAHMAVIGFQPRARKLDILDSLERQDFRLACGNTEAAPETLSPAWQQQHPRHPGLAGVSSFSSGAFFPVGLPCSPFPSLPFQEASRTLLDSGPRARGRGAWAPGQPPRLPLCPRNSPFLRYRALYRLCAKRNPQNAFVVTLSVAAGDSISRPRDRQELASMELIMQTFRKGGWQRGPRPGIKEAGVAVIGTM